MNDDHRKLTAEVEEHTKIPLLYWEWRVLSLEPLELEPVKVTSEIDSVNENDIPLNLMDVAKTVHPDDRDYFNQITANFFEGGEITSARFRIIRPTDGQVRTLFAQGKLYYDRDGKPDRVIGTTQDITDYMDFSQLENISHALVEKIQQQRETQESLRSQFIKECNKYSREIHDRVGPELAEIISMTEERRDDPFIESLNRRATRVMERLRELIKFISDGEKRAVHLGRDISAWLDRFEATGKISVVRQYDYEYSPDNFNTGNNLMAIFSEWMTNLLKHSQATRVLVRIKRSGTNRALIISSDGKSFSWNGVDSSNEGHGLNNIHYRTADLGGRVRVFPRTRGGAIFLLRFIEQLESDCQPGINASSVQ